MGDYHMDGSFSEQNVAFGYGSQRRRSALWGQEETNPMLRTLAARPTLRPCPDLPPSAPRARLLPLLLVALLPGCLGDQFGGESGGGEEVGCIDAQRQTFDLDEVTPIGFRGKDILDFAASTFDVPFSLSTDYTQLSVVPTSDTRLEVSIASESESVTYVDRELGPDSPPATYCLDYLEIEGEVTLRADNGAFDDTLPLLLRSRQMLTASAEVDLDAGVMQGSFDVTHEAELPGGNPDHPLDQWTLDHSLLELGVSPNGLSGSITAFYDVSNDEGTWLGLEVLWRSPEEEGTACPSEDFGGPLDGGTAVTHLRELLTDTPRLSLHFTSGGAADVELDAAIQPDAEFCIGGNSQPILSFSGQIALTRADDGQPFATWPMGGYVLYTPEGQLEIIKMSGVTYLGQPFDAEDVATAFGEFGVDFSDHDQADVAFWLDTDGSSGWTGELHLEGDLEVLAKATVEELE